MENISTFHFPALFLIPEFEDDRVECGPFAVTRRLWEISTFDLATLATRHSLHLPYQVMDVLLSRCNLEISVSGQQSLEEAINRMQTFRIALYAVGASPFLVPFAASHSINEYAGINSRDSKALREKMPEEMREGITSDTSEVEAWPMELSLESVVLADSLHLSADQIKTASGIAEKWTRIKLHNQRLHAVEEIAIASPKCMPPSQSLLHIWSGLEALFPQVSVELSFRLALYLAQLISPSGEKARVFERARASYNLRSKLSHGSKSSILLEEWEVAWRLLVDAIGAILSRGGVPEEDHLLDELLSPSQD
jgi:hypothetical protein